MTWKWSSCTSFVILYRYCKRVTNIRSDCSAGIAREQVERENRKRLKINGRFVSKFLGCVYELAAGTFAECQPHRKIGNTKG